MKNRFAKLILKWYDRNARRLPWRAVIDPYAIWVSEVMLQQTQVETVIPYYQRWMERFPDVQALAAATEQEVLGVWEGLGYYTRARHLWQAAGKLINDYDAHLPRDTRSLEKLPGVGRYTAGAIASIAFGVDAPALDGNIKRVLARVFDVDLPIDKPAGLKRLWTLAAELLPHGRVGDHNQALMDLGALICMPKHPLCAECPLKGICLAFRQGCVMERPVKTPKKTTTHITVTAAIIRRSGRVLIARRPYKGLLGGLWEFPGGKQQAGETLKEALRREILEELAADVEVGNELGVYHHAYTHFRVTLHAFICKLAGAKPQPLEASELAWVNPKALGAYPMGRIDRRISNDLLSPPSDGAHR